MATSPEVRESILQCNRGGMNVYENATKHGVHFSTVKNIVRFAGEEVASMRDSKVPVIAAMIGMGLSNTEIAKRVQCVRSNVSYVRNLLERSGHFHVKKNS
jgi:transposase-like protein